MNDEKRAEEWAYTQVAKLMKEGVIPSDAGTLEIAEYSYAAGVRAERERIDKLIGFDGNTQCTGKELLKRIGNLTWRDDEYGPPEEVER